MKCVNKITDNNNKISNVVCSIPVDCPVGSFYNNATGACELCEEGTLSSKERQTQCDLCPQGKTTGAPGAVNQSDCYGNNPKQCWF